MVYTYEISSNSNVSRTFLERYVSRTLLERSDSMFEERSWNVTVQ